MNRSSLAIFLAAAALGMAGCGAPAANSSANNANSNTNASKPAAAAPTTDALLALDKQLGDAWAKSDAKFFEENLSDKFVEYSNGHRYNKADAVKMIGQMKCEVKSTANSDAKMSRIDDNSYALTYKSTTDATCARAGRKGREDPESDSGSYRICSRRREMESGFPRRESDTGRSGIRDGITPVHRKEG